MIFQRLGPYHVARLSATADVCEVVAIEIAAETKEYAWARVESANVCERVTLFPEGDGRVMTAKEMPQRMRFALSNCHPEAVAIPGWSTNGAFAALDWCAATGTPAILMSESTAIDEPRRSWREGIKRRVVGLYAGALVGGQPQIDYLVELGMPRARISTGYDAVDNGYFARGAKEVRSKKEEVRKRFELPENYFLASARFIEKKNLGGLIRAYADYVRRCECEKVENWDLVLLGDGPLRDSLNSQLSALNLHANVHLPGFKQYDELPVYYGLASGFVHGSTTEQWGLVVNEAMASGLPVLVSNRCGCAIDLVQEGRNGFTFDPSDIEQLAQLMLKLSAFQPFKLSAFGDASRQIISGFDVAAFGRGLLQAVEVALQRCVVRPGLLDRSLLQLLLRR